MNTKEQANVASVVAYSISDDVELQVRAILHDILEIHNCQDLLAPIYTSVKELIINAIKANFKNIYFEDYAPKNKSDEMIKYETALQLFQLEMSRENARNLERIARKQGIKAEIDFWTVENMLHVIVSNPVRMTEMELNNIKQKLVDAEQCVDLADYFLQNIDDPHREGAGLGLILIMMMLKSLQAPKDSLVIMSDDEKTRAYLKIPLVNEVSNCA
jgi:hypothetical protein